MTVQINVYSQEKPSNNDLSNTANLLVYFFSYKRSVHLRRTVCRRRSFTCLSRNRGDCWKFHDRLGWILVKLMWVYSWTYFIYERFTFYPVRDYVCWGATKAIIVHFMRNTVQECLYHSKCCVGTQGFHPK